MIALWRLPVILAQRVAPRLSAPGLLACWGLSVAAFAGADYLGEQFVAGWADNVIVGIVFLIPLFTLLVTLDWFHVRHAGPEGIREGKVIPRVAGPARVLCGLLAVVAFAGAGLVVTLPARPGVATAAGLFVIGAIAAWVALTGRVRSTVVRL